jgi:hypothetical protein
MSTNNDYALLDACIESNVSLAMELIVQGRGLRNYCPNRNLEPLTACAKNGLSCCFSNLMARAYYDEAESTLCIAMGEAVSHGHADIAKLAWEEGAELDYGSIDKAIDNGHLSSLRELMALGAIEPGAPHNGFQSPLDYLLSAFCSRGMDAEACECLENGALFRSEIDNESLDNVGLHHMHATATWWLYHHPFTAHPPPITWQEAFPALLLSIREARDFNKLVASQHSDYSKIRL